MLFFTAIYPFLHTVVCVSKVSHKYYTRKFSFVSVGIIFACTSYVLCLVGVNGMEWNGMSIKKKK